MGTQKKILVKDEFEMEKRTRPRQVKFWVTEDELNEINDKVNLAKLTKQEYLLRSALNKKITVIPGLKELLVELSKEGNSLNKLQRDFSEGREINAAEIKKVQKNLVNLWALIDSTLKEGRGEE